MPPMLDELIALAKRRGFIYPTSSIYGGLANAYDYGPVGVELLRNIRNIWWREFIHKREDMVGIDSQIILHPRTWEASGHVSSFSDPLIEDVKTHKRYRVDHLIEVWIESQVQKGINVSLAKPLEAMSLEEMGAFIIEHRIMSPEGNALSNPKKFNLLFSTHIGAVEEEKSLAYLRGETAQGIFTNFKHVIESTRVKPPFGIGQIGKAFRNEITTGQFIFRTFEFEQAEIEYFFDADETNWETLYGSWKEAMWHFVTQVCGVSSEHLTWYRHSDAERSHYSKETNDLMYAFPFGVKELWGIAYRTTYDLQQHMKYSGVKLDYTDPVTGKTYTPHVIEPAVGLNRLFLMLLSEHYHVTPERTYLSLPQSLAPYRVAVFPLVANKPELVSKARELCNSLRNHFVTYWDDRGNIGKRYKYQDEVGTPSCVTIDFQTLEDQTVTVRDRDTMKQERVAIPQLIEYLNQ
ncbi:MAG: glycine--tRNA ligase [Candidatus Roizmanbacteria bacterium]|nr:glycine--tRNA ligase [Candidatus Roizmanbacteria bacterium]